MYNWIQNINTMTIEYFPLPYRHPGVHVVEVDDEGLVLAVVVLGPALVLGKVHPDHPLQRDVPRLVRHGHVGEPHLRLGEDEGGRSDADGDVHGGVLVVQQADGAHLLHHHVRGRDVPGDALLQLAGVAAHDDDGGEVRLSD